MKTITGLEAEIASLRASYPTLADIEARADEMVAILQRAARLAPVVFDAAAKVRAMAFTRGNFNPAEAMNFAQQAKSSLPNYSERSSPRSPLC